MDAEAIAQRAKALAHPARVRIVELLASQTQCRGAEIFGDLDLAQSTVSEHLRVLRDAGIISSSAVGTSAVYCLHTPVLAEFAESIGKLAVDTPVCLIGEERS